MLKKDKHFGRFRSQTCAKPLLEMRVPAAGFQPARHQLRNTGPRSRPPRFLRPGSSTKAALRGPSSAGRQLTASPRDSLGSPSPPEQPRGPQGLLLLTFHSASTDPGEGKPSCPTDGALRVCPKLLGPANKEGTRRAGKAPQDAGPCTSCPCGAAAATPLLLLRSLSRVLISHRLLLQRGFQQRRRGNDLRGRGQLHVAAPAHRSPLGGTS